MVRKRRRYEGDGDIYMSTNRPVEKQVFQVRQSITTSQTDNTIVPVLSTGQAATLDGIRGTLTLTGSGTGGNFTILFYKRPEGIAAPVLSAPTTTSAAPASGLPEQNILYALTGAFSTGTSFQIIPLEIKTKRKLHSEDSVYMSTLGTSSCAHVSLIWSNFLKK